MTLLTVVTTKVVVRLVRGGETMEEKSDTLPSTRDKRGKAPQL